MAPSKKQRNCTNKKGAENSSSVAKASKPIKYNQPFDNDVKEIITDSQWKEILPSFSKAYQKYASKNKKSNSLLTEYPAENLSCSCSIEHHRTEKVDLVFYHNRLKNHIVNYCKVCKPLSVALIEMGMLPISLYQPKRAFHISICESWHRMENIFDDATINQLAEYFNLQYPNEIPPLMSGSTVSTLLTLYNKITRGGK